MLLHSLLNLRYNYDHFEKDSETGFSPFFFSPFFYYFRFFFFFFPDYSPDCSNDDPDFSLSFLFPPQIDNFASRYWSTRFNSIQYIPPFVSDYHAYDGG